MTDPLVSEARVQAIQARVDAATQGPWSYDRHEFANGEIQYVVDCEDDVIDASVAVAIERRPDADFIAHAREDIPYLLDALTAHHEALDTLRQEHQQEHDDLLAWEAKVRDVEAEADTLRQERDRLLQDCKDFRETIRELAEGATRLGLLRHAAEAECATLRAHLAVVSSEPQTP